MRSTRILLGITGFLLILGLGCAAQHEDRDAWAGQSDNDVIQGIFDTDAVTTGNDTRHNGTEVSIPDIPKRDLRPQEIQEPDFGGGNQGNTGRLTVALRRAQKCSDITEKWRRMLINAMRDRLHDEWYSAAHWYEPCYNGGGDVAWGYGDTVAMDASMGYSDTGSAGGADSYSTTNNQVPGVDEADIMKNDGKWIYVLANGRLQIVDAWPPDQAHKVSDTPVQGTPVSMLTYKDRLTVFSVDQNYTPECDYAYDCDVTGRGVGTRVTTYDISDRGKPVRIRQTYLPQGHFVNARRIGPQVYVVVFLPMDNLYSLLYSTGLKFVPDSVAAAEASAQCEHPLDMSQDAIRQAFEDLYRKNVEIINKMDLDSYVNGMSDTVYTRDGWSRHLKTPLDNCNAYYLSNGSRDMDLIAVLGFDITKQEPLSAAVVRSKPGIVFATHQSLYISMWYNKYRESDWFDGVNDSALTVIHRFDLQPGTPDVTYHASGWVPGHALNQFSMDEQDEYVRIATTVDWKRVSLVTVLKPDGRDLKVVGQLNNIAPGEDIRAVRFNGNLGFVVTFKKTDPLFVIDLSDPTKPKIKGKLKIPGYSTYMHFMDRNHLLSIGYDAQDEGNFAWFQGVQLQVFDVTNITQPKLLHKTVIGTRGTASEAALHHLAFNYFKPKDLLAIPMVICEGGQGGSDYGDYMTFNGLMVYHVTIDDGFKYLGGIAHDTGKAGDYNDRCGQWWSNSTSTVKRSIFLDDHVVSVAMDRLDFAPLSDLKHVEASVSLR